MEVLRHTAARFVVTNNFDEDLDVLRRYVPWIFLPYASVIMCYEFKLERRRASGPVMHARFTRAMDPAFKLKPEWLSLSASDQIIIESWATLDAEFGPLQALRVDEDSDTNMLFCFLRGGPPLMPRMLVEIAPRWSRFPRSVLADVREKMETVFHLPLGSM
jgi:hypothetical protein